MNELKLTSQFKKDLKRYKHKAAVIDKLENILNLLAEGLPVPEENRPHILTGNYKGYYCCPLKREYNNLSSMYHTFYMRFSQRAAGGGVQNLSPVSSGG